MTIDSASPVRPRILLVEDDQLILKLLVCLLEYEGCVVDTAEHGRLGLELIASGKTYDLIILDSLMPVMDGTAFLRTLRTELGSSTPALIVSSQQRNPHGDDLRNLGVIGALRKPLVVPEFLSALRQFLPQRSG